MLKFMKKMADILYLKVWMKARISPMCFGVLSKSALKEQFSLWGSIIKKILNRWHLIEDIKPWLRKMKVMKFVLFLIMIIEDS